MVDEPQNSFDVVIIGGGPAGTAAALSFLIYSDLKVMVIESTNYSNIRIGEYVSPGILPLLRYLDLENDFLKDGHLPSYGIDSAWGSPRVISNSFLFSGHGTGWSLDRQKFDQMMAFKVREKGGTLLTSSVISHQEKNDRGRWHIIAQTTTGKKIKLMSDFVIDASGKKGSFARKIGAKWNMSDKLIGIGGFYQEDHIDKKQVALIESTPYGWWYTSSLPNSKRIVFFMTDSDIGKKLQTHKLQNWNIMLAKTNHIKKTIIQKNLVLQPKIYSAHSQLITHGDFSNWLPAGDTAVSFDPASSMGIGHAIISGIESARVAHRSINHHDCTLQYLENIVKNFNRYLIQRKKYYSHERRWKNNIFWKRRNQQ